MLHDPVFLQYLTLGLAAFGATVLVLFFYHRIVARRKRAGDLAAELRDLGLNRLADPIDCYSHGDYSGTIEGFAALAKEIRAGGGIALLETAVVKVVTHYAANHATKAQELLDILYKGTALKEAAKPAAPGT